MSFHISSTVFLAKEKLLVQWSSNPRVPQTSLKGLFRHRSLGTNSRAYDWIGLHRTQRFLEFLCNTVSPPCSKHIFRMHPQQGNKKFKHGKHDWEKAGTMKSLLSIQNTFMFSHSLQSIVGLNLLHFSRKLSAFKGKSQNANSYSSLPTANSTFISSDS